ncbi:MAG TPA: alanine racemase [Nocardioidaceae bacterium]|nr:alanine racemase [Nocardioidaceae bacterium]
MIEQRATPFLLVDPAVVTGNVGRMAAFSRDHGVALRPHAKTHKCTQVAKQQRDAGALGLTVATVSEAEVFADAGFRDLFLAYPVWVDAAKGLRLRELKEQAEVVVGVDSAEGARALAAQVPGSAVLVEVDSGHHRTGVAPAHAGTVAVCAARAGLDVRGVFTFPGHSYAPGVAEAVAAQEAAALRTAVTSLSQQGIEARVVSGGSTPSAAEVDAGVLTEMRPGVYVFGDAQQWELDSTTPDRIGLTCVATVVSRAEDRVVLDSGSKVLGADRAGYATGFGRLLDHPDARVVSLSEHHAVVAWDRSPAPEPGSRLRVVPNHVCSAVNLADELVLADGSSWPVAARGTNT